MWGLVLAGAAVAALVAWISMRGRRRLYKEFARRSGYAVDMNADGVLQALGKVPLFQEGYSHRAHSLLAKGRGADEVWVFEHHGSNRSWASESLQCQTIVAFPSMPHSLPVFSLRPGEDVGCVEELFDREVIDALWGHRDFCVEGAGRVLVVYRQESILGLTELDEFVNEARRVRAIIANSGVRSQD